MAHEAVLAMEKRYAEKVFCYWVKSFSHQTEAHTLQHRKLVFGCQAVIVDFSFTNLRFKGQARYWDSPFIENRVYSFTDIGFPSRSLFFRTDLPI